MCAFIVMELLRITRKIHYKAVEQTATLIHRQYNRDWGTSYSRPPIDPYLTSPCYKILAAPQHGGAILLGIESAPLSEDEDYYHNVQCSVFDCILPTDS